MDIIKSIEPIIQKIILHPFLQQLSEGVLDKNIYHYYLVQDYYYLQDYSKALLCLSESAIEPVERDFFKSCASVCEQEPAFEIKDLILDKNITLTRACQDYLQLFKTHLHDYAGGVAAVFPCFYVYHRVANSLYPSDSSSLLAHGLPSAPESARISKCFEYAKWFETYTSESFTHQNRVILKILEKEYSNSNQKKMLEDIIIQGCELEFRFWDECL